MSLRSLRIEAAFGVGKKVRETEEEARKGFFELVDNFHRRGSSSYRFIEKAYIVLENLSIGKLRGDGRAYISHPREIAVAMILLGYTDPIMIVVALFHDLLEDFKEWTFERLATEFGIEVARGVEVLTRPLLSKEVPTKEIRDKLYIQELNDAELWIKLVKILNRLNNMKTYLTYYRHNKKRLKHKIRETEDKILPMAEDIGYGDDLRAFIEKWLREESQKKH